MENTVSEIIICDFTVALGLVGMVAIRLSGRQFYGDQSVVAAMPRATVARGKIHFFQVGRFVRPEEFALEHEKRGLIPADPYTLAAFNGANREFADTHSNGTQWYDAAGKFCYARFILWNNKRRVYVRRHDNIWNDRYWLAGFSK